MLVAPLSVHRPRDLPDAPLLANPPHFDPSPELARIIRKLSPSGDIEEAWYEYDRRVCAFRNTDEGLRFWNNGTLRDKIATGITSDDHEILNRAYFAWRDSFIDWDEVARLDYVRRHQRLKGPQICGWCGGEFASMADLSMHQGYCHFNPECRLDLASIVYK